VELIRRIVNSPHRIEVRMEQRSMQDIDDVRSYPLVVFENFSCRDRSRPVATDVRKQPGKIWKPLFDESRHTRMPADQCRAPVQKRFQGYQIELIVAGRHEHDGLLPDQLPQFGLSDRWQDLWTEPALARDAVENCPRVGALMIDALVSDKNGAAI